MGFTSDYSRRLHALATFLGKDESAADQAVQDLCDRALVAGISRRCDGVPGFEPTRLKDIGAFHLFRTFLYVLVRLLRPAIFLETGVLHGFSSAFILQALEDNRHGRLVSIDLPHVDGRFVDQGTHLLPAGHRVGWAIPDDLRHRHDLRLGRAEQLLCAYFLSEPKPDVFMHDSDHSYRHMMFEMSMAAAHMTSEAVLVVDNVEANDSFADFCRGAGCRSITVESFPRQHPEYWVHGVAVL